MGAHVGRALEDRLYQGTSRAGVNVLCRERGLGLGGFADRLGQIAALGSTTVKDAGLVEVEVRFDESGGNQPAVEVNRFALGFEPRGDRRDPSRGDPDVAALPIVDSRVLQDQIHGHASPFCLGECVSTERRQ